MAAPCEKSPGKHLSTPSTGTHPVISSPLQRGPARSGTADSPVHKASLCLSLHGYAWQLELFPQLQEQAGFPDFFVTFHDHIAASGLCTIAGSCLRDRMRAELTCRLSAGGSSCQQPSCARRPGWQPRRPAHSAPGPGGCSSPRPSPQYPLLAAAGRPARCCRAPLHTTILHISTAYMQHVTQYSVCCERQARHKCKYHKIIIHKSGR